MKIPAVSEVEGVRLIRAIVNARGLGDVAKKIKCSEAGIRNWLALRRRPDSDARMAMFEAYDIPIAAWSAPVSKPAPPPKKHLPSAPPSQAPPEPPPSSEPELPIDASSSKDLVRRQLAKIRGRIEKAESDGVGLRELSALENSYTNAVRLYSRLCGELEITEATILRSSAWQKLLRLVREALERFPDAAKAIAEKIEEFGSGA